MKDIKLILVAFMLIFVAGNLQGQERRKFIVGTNLYQMPATTFSVSLNQSKFPNFENLTEIGYTHNYLLGFDPMYFLILHCDCGNDGYNPEIQKGFYLKGGGIWNFRKTFDKKFFFSTGFGSTTSLVYEVADYTNQFDWLSHQKHYVLILSLNQYFLMNWEIKKYRLQAGLLVSETFLNGKRLYGYENYVAGIGLRHTILNYAYSIPVLNVQYIF